MANLLNFSSAPAALTVMDTLIRGKEPAMLLRNKYFHWLSRQGYQFNVLANSGHIDYCSESRSLIINCVEYPFREGMKRFKDSDLAIGDKLRIIFAHFLNLGYSIKGSKYAYKRYRRTLSEWGLVLPPWYVTPKYPRMPLSSLVVLDELAEQIGTLPSGNVLFCPPNIST